MSKGVSNRSQRRLLWAGDIARKEEGRFVRWSILVFAVATSLVAPLALAAPAEGQKTEARAGDAPKFPMKAAEFQQKVDARTVKAREHMEKRLTKHSATDTQKKEARAKFDAGVAEIQKVVSVATADGVVTKDEAQKVREKAKEVRHAGRAARHGHKK